MSHSKPQSNSTGQPKLGKSEINRAFGVALKLLTGLEVLCDCYRGKARAKPAALARLGIRYWDKHMQLLQRALPAFNHAAQGLGDRAVSIGETSGRSAFDIVLRLAGKVRPLLSDRVIEAGDAPPAIVGPRGATTIVPSYMRLRFERAIARVEGTIRHGGDTDALALRLHDERREAIKMASGTADEANFQRVPGYQTPRFWFDHLKLESGEVTYAAFEKAIRTWRCNNPGGDFHQIENKKARESRFAYPYQIVLPIAEELVNRAKRRASVARKK